MRHQGLFTKLRAAGIKGAAHQWLVNFLTDRAIDHSYLDTVGEKVD